MGGKSKSVTIGYKYLMGVQIALSHGEVDAITEFIFGERSAWTGSVTANGTISINQPQLFGGDSREGGVVGAIDIALGGVTQGRNSYLAQYQGANCPAYRGLATIVFKDFQWSSGNPYFKSPWVRARRIVKGWYNNVVWNSSQATIGIDMNPAHIIYQCLTDPRWGMGYNASDIDTTSFNAAANTLLTENFGISIFWNTQSQINTFIQLILTHINGAIRMDLATGKFALKLIRDDYTIGALTVVDESNTLQLKSFERSAFGDNANEVIVEYSDRDENVKTIAVQDLASIQAQGSIVSTTRSYLGIRDPAIAARVALRDLALVSSPLAKLNLNVDRVLWAHEVGDVIAFTWADLGITLAPFRITKIDKGTLQSGRIDVELVEDVFGLPSSSYTQTPGSQWTDTLVPPVAPEAYRTVEAPYWEVVRSMTAADIAYLDPQYAFGGTMAVRGILNNPYNYTIAGSASSGGPFIDVLIEDFVPTGLLSADVGFTDTTFTIASFYDLDQVELDSTSNSTFGYMYVDNECMAVTSINVTTGVLVVRRGVLDTPPSKHLSGARAYFVGDSVSFDPTERVNGETVFYKIKPTTAYGTMDVNLAPLAFITLANRANRPYPPGQFKINATYYPVNVGGSISSSWVARNRLQQTASLIDYLAGSITPETDTTYYLRVYSGVILKQLYWISSGVIWSYSVADEATHGYVQTLRITVASVVGSVAGVGGIESLYPDDITFERYGLGFHLGESLGGAVPP